MIATLRAAARHFIVLSPALFVLACHETTEDDLGTPGEDVTAPGDTGGGNTDGGDTGEPRFQNGCENDTDCAGVVFEDLSVCERVSCDLATKKCIRGDAADGTSCTDGDQCTTNDQCKAGACSGAGKTCNDENPCTNDLCNPDTGKCEANPNSALCDDGNLCTLNDQCANGACTGQTNPACQCEVDADCAKFDDADLCNGTLACTDKQCVVKEGSEVGCTAGTDPCSSTACDPADGKCKETPAGDGSACDDGDKCTKSDRCAAGKCTGKALTCDDKNPCTDDSCDSATGCTTAANTGACDDGDLCTTDDACKQGTCTGATNPACQCTTAADCATFEDGDLCNGTLVCNNSKCEVDTATVVDCSADAAAAPACQTVVCEPTNGKCETRPALDGGSCDDGSLCSSSDVCDAGACKGTAVVCNDGNACTDDTCDPAAGCKTAFNTASCDDGSACTSNDKCSGGECAGSGDCACETTADCASAEDGNLCNGTLACVNKLCKLVPSTVVTCDTNGLTACQTAECIPDTGKCITRNLSSGDLCNDGDACSENDVCTDGLCKGKPVVCDDGNLCTSDSCELASGCKYVFNNVPCDDGVSCTTGDTCNLGSCSGTPSPECTCTTDADCAASDDADKCNGTLKCQVVAGAGKCVVDPASVVVCPPSDSPCKISACNAGTGACDLGNAAEDKPCDDGDACTAGETCTAGACEGGTAAKCDDENPCTTDSCDAIQGCRYENNTASCDDGDPCTLADVCGEGACQPGDANPACEASCKASWNLGCGSFDSWDTGSFGATDLVDSYACSEDSFPGGEYTYLFQASFDAKVRITLSNEDAATDIHVLAQSDIGCDPKACITTGYSTATVDVKAGESYYFVVDTYVSEFFDLETGGYTIEVDCVPATETFCQDGVDNDEDDSTDCEDSDCATNIACTPDICESSWTLSCGGSDSWSNYQFGSTNNVSEYASCDNPFTYPGPEYTYVWDAPADGPVTVTLTDESSFGTDIMVLTDDNGVCAAANCAGWGLDDVTFDAVAGQRYYFVVDGWNGAEGTYDISVTCGAAGETACADGLDNDEDSSTDCADTDCAALPACQVNCDPVIATPVACDSATVLSTGVAASTKDVIDAYSCNTGEVSGLTGPEVAATFVAPYTGLVLFEILETNPKTTLMVIENEAGLCLPANCLDSGTLVLADVEKGKSYTVVVDGTLTDKFTLEITCDQPSTEQLCDDGVDDDLDGFADCEDEDCFMLSDLCDLACSPATDSFATLVCDDDSDSFSNDGFGSADDVVYYNCVERLNVFTYSGPEYTYTYVADTSGPVTVTLTEPDFGNDLDLMLLVDKGLGCNPASCQDWDEDTLTFDAVAGTTYHLVVDGFLGAVSTYELAFSCGAQ